MATSSPPPNRFAGSAKLAVAGLATAHLAATCGPVDPTRTARGPSYREPAAVEEVVDGSGDVVGGSFQDSSYPYGLAVAEGWVARPGAADGALRLTLAHVSTGATLEVWVFHEARLAPRPRAGCEWTFVDGGVYGGLRLADARQVATCVPDDPDAPLVLSQALVRDALAYHFELIVPSGRLVQARRAASALLDGVRFY